MTDKISIKENADTIPTAVQREFYEIHVKGHLDVSWTDWLEDLEMKLLDNGEMIRYGHIRARPL